MKLSVLIGSRDRIDVLLRCLDHVLQQRCPSFEVLILDDNSSRYCLAEQITARFQDDRLRCFRSKTALGVAGGRNFLMQQAGGDIFCVIDDDAYFAHERCLAHIVDAFEHQPHLGILAAKVIDHQQGRTKLLVPFSRYARRKWPGIVNERQPVSYFLGTCHAIRRSVFETCGGYRADLMFGEEELDLSYRAVERKFELVYWPEVTVYHYPEASVVGRKAGYRHPELYYHIRNRFFLSYKYLPWPYIPVYLSFWLSVYGREALKLSAHREYLAGLKAGLAVLNSTDRTPLSGESVRYLKSHYGRLWY
ncbi:MAG: glycosyltransferase [Anaerolineaceae bacterium]|nr:glycosyltransferase [Anaerolineaceae bacterium]